MLNFIKYIQKSSISSGTCHKKWKIDIYVIPFFEWRISLYLRNFTKILNIANMNWFFLSIYPSLNFSKKVALFLFSLQIQYHSRPQTSVTQTGGCNMYLHIYTSHSKLNIPLIIIYGEYVHNVNIWKPYTYAKHVGTFPRNPTAIHS